MKYIPKPDPEEINSSQTHNYFRDALILVAGFAGILITVYMLLISVSDWALSRISLEQEIRWLGKIWPQDSSEEKIPGAINQLISQINTHTPFPLNVNIMCSDEANAFALPGGLIFLTSGLLKILETENGLTFVLGHEAGHIVHRDSIQGMGREIILAIGAMIISFGGGSDLLAFHQFIARVYSIDQENEADDYGLVVMQKVYGHTWGAEELFQLLSNKETLLEKSLAQLSSTHPSFQARLRKIKQSQRGNPQQSNKLSPAIKDWLQESKCHGK